jgi:hypothetical protein
LTLIFPNRQTLIVENKVKSLASLEQLKDYSAKAKECDSFLLLSLTRPSFVKGANTFQADGQNWHFLSYNDMIGLLNQAIAEISLINKYHGDILRDYHDFVASLVEATDYVSVDWANEQADFFQQRKRQTSPRDSTSRPDGQDTVCTTGREDRGNTRFSRMLCSGEGRFLR